MLPSTGHAQDTNQIMIGVTSADFSIRNASIVRSPCVGFCTVIVDMELPKEGYPTDIQIDFTTSVDLTTSDTVRLVLPEFTCSSGMVRPLNTSSNGVSAVWEPSLSSINLTLAANFSAGATVSTTIERVEHLRLPEYALERNDPSIQVCGSLAKLGTLSCSSIVQSNPVGIMLFSKLAYSYPAAGAPTSITVNFVASSAILAGEVVTLYLPGFEADSDISELQLLGDFEGSWNNTYHYLDFVSSKDIESSNGTSVTILLANGIRLPERGLDVNDSSLLISTSAVSGPIVSVSIASSPGVGRLMESKLVYSDPLPGANTSMSFFFQLNSELSVGDSLYLFLPGFYLPDQTEVPLLVNGPHNGNFTGYWWMSNSTLRIEAHTSIGPVWYNLTIPRSSGLRSPESGLYKDDSRLRIWTSSLLCPIQPVGITSSPAVGIVASSISFSPGEMGVPNEVIVGFQLTSALRVGDRILILLPGFSYPSSSGAGGRIMMSVDGPYQDAFTAVFENATPTVNATVLTPMEALTSINLIFGRSIGLIPPPVGVTSSSGLVLGIVRNTSVAANESTASSFHITFQNISPISTFLYSTASFNPASAGSATSLYLNFSLNSELSKGDKVVLYLQGFGGVSSSSILLNGTDADNFITSWDVASQYLTLISLVSKISAGDLYVDISNGLTLPQEGINPDSGSLMISSGSVVFEAIKTVQGVVAFSGTSISFFSTDLDSMAWLRGSGSVVRFPPGYVLYNDSIEEKFLVGQQIMTVQGVHGEYVYMKEAYQYEGVHVGSPLLTVSTPGYRSADFVSGNETTCMTFNYVVRPGDMTDDLDVYNSSFYYPDDQSYIRRSTSTPLTNIDPALPSPGTARSLSYNKDLLINTSSPTVIQIKSSKPKGTYTEGDTVDISIYFDMPVSVQINNSYVPLLALWVRTQDNGTRYATYSSGSGTSTLTFLYEIESGDSSSACSTGYLDIYNGEQLPYGQSALIEVFGTHVGFIRRASTNPITPINPVLPLPGFFYSLSNTSQIYVSENAARAIKVYSNISTSADEAIEVGTGQEIYIFVEFSDMVTVEGSAGLPYIMLETGSAGSVASFVGSNQTGKLIFLYQVQEGDASLRLDYRCQCADYTDTTFLVLNGSQILNASTVLPAPGESGSLSRSNSIVVDTSRPQVKDVYGITSDGTFGPGEVIDIAIEFDNPVVVTGSPRLELEVGDEYCYAYYLYGTSTKQLFFRYTAEVGHGTSHLDYKDSASLDLNGGSIKRFSTHSTTDALLTLPVPGRVHSLGSNSNLRIDPSTPKILSVNVPSILQAPNPKTQTLDILNESVSSFRLYYGSAFTGCLLPNISASELEESINELRPLRVRVTEQNEISVGKRFLIFLESPTSARSTFVSTDCSTSPKSCSSSSDQAKLPVLNRDISNNIHSGVVDIELFFSAPVAVSGFPYYSFKSGSVEKRAYYAAGASVQYIDVGVTASSKLVKGEFQLKYGDLYTNCIGWNVADAMQSNALKARLLEIPDIAAIGIQSVTGQDWGNGYRFAITFTGENPRALEVVQPALSSDTCRAFVPSDVEVSLEEQYRVIFRYFVEQSPQLSMKLRENATMPSPSLSLAIPMDAELTTPSLGSMEGTNYLTLSIDSKNIPLATVLPYPPLPKFQVSSISFGSEVAGNVSSVTCNFQLNAPLIMGDSINISLPRFSCISGTTTLYLEGSHNFVGVWDSAQEILKVTVQQDIPAHTDFKIVIPESQGLVLPRTGVDEKCSNLQVSLWSSEGEIDYHRFRSCDPVGFAFSSLTYGNLRAGEVTNITFSFKLGADLNPGEQVVKKEK